jgi:hypothetical protein
VAAPQYPTDNRLFRIVRASASPYGWVLQVSNTQGRTWDQVSVVPCGAAGSPPVLLMLSPTFGRDSTLLARNASSTPCAISRNAGQSWTGPPARVASGYSNGTTVFSPTFAQESVAARSYRWPDESGDIE